MLSADQSQKAKDLGTVFKAMSKVMSNDDAHIKYCCICVMKGSYTAVASDGNILTAVNVAAFENAADDNIVQAYELVAFYAGLKMIEYTNSFVFVGKKLYEKFISAFTDGLSGLNTSDFEYFNWTKVIPEWEELTNEIQGTYDPKVLCIVNKVIDAYFDKHEEHFEDRVFEKKNHAVGFAMFDQMVVIVSAKPRGEDYSKVQMNRGDFEHLKTISHYYNSEE